MPDAAYLTGTPPLAASTSSRVACALAVLSGETVGESVGSAPDGAEGLLPVGGRGTCVFVFCWSSGMVIGRDRSRGVLGSRMYSCAGGLCGNTGAHTVSAGRGPVQTPAGVSVSVPA